MAEKQNPGLAKSFWESSKPPSGEEGVLGPGDTWNRASYRISKPLAIGSTVALLAGVPFALTAFGITGIWAGSDKLQIEGSKKARRWLKRGDMKPGHEVNLHKQA